MPGIDADLAERGTRAAVVISAGFGEGGKARGAGLRQAMLAAGKHRLMRIFGPTGLGIMVPGIGLERQLCAHRSTARALAPVAQSGAMVAAARTGRPGAASASRTRPRSVADVNFGDMLDYLVNDPETRAISPCRRDDQQRPQKSCRQAAPPPA